LKTKAKFVFNNERKKVFKTTIYDEKQPLNVTELTQHLTQRFFSDLHSNPRLAFVMSASMTQGKFNFFFSFDIGEVLVSMLSNFFFDLGEEAK
jgi:hypothetical protein